MEHVAALTERHLRERRPKQALVLARCLVKKRNTLAHRRLLASAAQQCGELALAARLWRSCRHDDPTNLYFLVNHAECELLLLHYASALPLLEEALARDPTSQHPAGVRARVLILKTQKKLS